MQSIRQVARLNDLELAKCTPPNASWHTDYRDTAYIYIGGLPYELSEGDVLTIFSQYGSPVHINLLRDQDTGKSRGFCFLKYEDQRSCDLAVDNLSGASVLGRTLSVDHTRYKKKEGEIETVGDDEMQDDSDDEGDETEREEGEERKVSARIGDRSRDERRGVREKSEERKSERRRLLTEEVELQQLLKDHDEEDPMKAYLIEQKREEVIEARKRADGERKKDGDERRRHHHRPERDRDATSRRHRHRHSRNDSNDDETSHKTARNSGKTALRDDSPAHARRRSGSRSRSRSRSKSPNSHDRRRRQDRKRSLSRDRTERRRQP